MRVCCSCSVDDDCFLSNGSVCVSAMLMRRLDLFSVSNRLFMLLLARFYTHDWAACSRSPVLDMILSRSVLSCHFLVHFAQLIDTNVT